MNKRIVILSATLALLSSTAGATVYTEPLHIDVPVITGKTYHDARKALLSSGWQPIRTISYNEVNSPDISYGNGEIFWSKGYVEIESCAGTGIAPCRFAFSDLYGNKLIVVTEGEEYPEEKTYATVSRYWLETE